MPTTAWQPLVYDAATDRRKYAWDTSTAWAGTCRELRLALNDGTPGRVAYFSFTK